MDHGAIFFKRIDNSNANWLYFIFLNDLGESILQSFAARGVQSAIEIDCEDVEDIDEDDGGDGDDDSEQEQSQIVGDKALVPQKAKKKR